MSLLFRRVRAGLAIAAGLGLACPARAASAASASYVLQRHAFTTGNPEAPAPPASADYRLAASNLGDRSGPMSTNATGRLYSGYLVPGEALWARPDLLRIDVQSGRIWLEWAAAGASATYTVESTGRMDAFAPVATGLPHEHWDQSLTTATSQYYRVRALSSP